MAKDEDDLFLAIFDPKAKKEHRLPAGQTRKSRQCGFPAPQEVPARQHHRLRLCGIAPQHAGFPVGVHGGGARVKNN